MASLLYTHYGLPTFSNVPSTLTEFKHMIKTQLVEALDAVQIKAGVNIYYRLGPLAEAVIFNYSEIIDSRPSYVTRFFCVFFYSILDIYFGHLHGWGMVSHGQLEAKIVEKVRCHDD